MKLFRFLPLFCVLLAICGSRVSAADGKPNIVFILADDLGINDLSCYGRKDQPTPNLDRLAGQGMRFTSAYCAQSICSPSRAAILTGKCPARLHLTNFLPGRADAASQKVRQPVIEGQLPLEETTLAEVLRGAGYATACVGKWHLGGAGFGPKAQAFDHYFAGNANTKPSAVEGGKGEYELTAEAVRWIGENKERPFFLYLAHNTPHVPLAAQPELIEKHRDAWNPMMAAMMETLDDCVGRVMAKLDESGLAERTIFIFTSDNGGLHVPEGAHSPSTHNAPFRAGKGFLYEGGLRVPLIVRWPGKVAPGVIADAPVVLTDWMPTLMEAAGLDPAKTTGPLDGVNLGKLLAGEASSPRTLFWHFPNYTNQGGRPAGAVREGDWKLIADDESGSVELFHLANDAGEKLDLSKEDAARAGAMKAKLDAWRKSVGAQMTIPNAEYDGALHRTLYEDTDVSRIEAGASAADIAMKLAGWRAAMNAAVKGRAVRVTPATGDIRLHAKDATVHGAQARYEDATFKNVIGFWTKPEDWVSWDFEVAKAGRYEVEIQQGCNGGGSEVAVEVAGQTLSFIVENTGHFQSMIARMIGEADLPAGKQTLAVKPRNKKGGAVMDLRRVVLRPVP
ncbi:MAG: sulfatase-like hydrolase/transferase [Chthoniobacteraceae bacterium]